MLFFLYKYNLGYELSTHASVHYARRELAQSLRSSVSFYLFFHIMKHSKSFNSFIKIDFTLNLDSI
jgi:hypothetical protein